MGCILAQKKLQGVINSMKATELLRLNRFVSEISDESVLCINPQTGELPLSLVAGLLVAKEIIGEMIAKNNKYIYYNTTYYTVERGQNICQVWPTYTERLVEND